jgi:hypothetical protein
VQGCPAQNHNAFDRILAEGCFHNMEPPTLAETTFPTMQLETSGVFYDIPYERRLDVGTQHQQQPSSHDALCGDFGVSSVYDEMGQRSSIDSEYFGEGIGFLYFQLSILLLTGACFSLCGSTHRHNTR